MDIRALLDAAPGGPVMVMSVTRLAEEDWPLLAAGFATAARHGDTLSVEADPDMDGLAWVTIRRP